MTGDVLVTGIGVVSAFGLGVDAFWDGLRAGRDACVPAGIPDAPAARVARVEGLEARRWVRSAQGRRIDRTSLLALAAARLALDDAGIAPEALRPPRTALGLGSAFGNVQETVAFLDRIFDRGTGNPMLFPNLVMNASAQLRGDRARHDRTVGDGDGAGCLGRGRDRVGRTPGRRRCGRRLPGRRRRRAGHGAAHDRPRDAHGIRMPGPCVGEGAAVLVLESAAEAHGRGARCYARLVPHAGFGVAGARPRLAVGRRATWHAAWRRSRPTSP